MPTTEYTEGNLNYDICRYCKYFVALYYQEIFTAFPCPSFTCTYDNIVKNNRKYESGGVKWH